MKKTLYFLFFILVGVTSCFYPMNLKIKTIELPACDDNFLWYNLVFSSCGQYGIFAKIDGAYHPELGNLNGDIDMHLYKKNIIKTLYLINFSGKKPTTKTIDLSSFKNNFRGKELSVCFSKSGKFFIIMGHSEYDAQLIKFDINRDKNTCNEAYSIKFANTDHYLSFDHNFEIINDNLLFISFYLKNEAIFEDEESEEGPDRYSNPFFLINLDDCKKNDITSIDTYKFVGKTNLDSLEKIHSTREILVLECALENDQKEEFNQRILEFTDFNNLKNKEILKIHNEARLVGIDDQQLIFTNQSNTKLGLFTLAKGEVKLKQAFDTTALEWFIFSQNYNLFQANFHADLFVASSKKYEDVFFWQISTGKFLGSFKLEGELIVNVISVSNDKVITLFNAENQIIYKLYCKPLEICYYLKNRPIGIGKKKFFGDKPRSYTEDGEIMAKNKEEIIEENN